VPKGYPSPRICEHCGGRTKTARTRYCSHKCFRAATSPRTSAQCERPGCSNLVQTVPSDRVRGGGRYCSRTCAYSVRRAPRPPVVCERMGCAELVAYTSTRARRFCSRSCARFSYWQQRQEGKTEHPLQTCQGCGSAFEWRSDPNAKNLYCSRTCFVAAHRVTVQCRTCDAPFEVQASRAATRTCPACRPLRDGYLLQCQRTGCTNTRRVPLSSDRKYCSYGCRDLARRVQRVQFICSRCGRQGERRPVVVGRSSKQFCTLRCYRAHLREKSPCQICGRARHGNPRFCSLRCAYKGRRARTRDPQVQHRNAWILQARAEGKFPKQIAFEWSDAHPSDRPLTWHTVRQVIHRVKATTNGRQRAGEINVTRRSAHNTAALARRVA
jgi:hypothetical protein